MRERLAVQGGVDQRSDRIWCRWVDNNASPINRNPSFGNQFDGARIDAVLLGQNAGGQGVGVIVGMYWNDSLDDDRSGVDSYNFV